MLFRLAASFAAVVLMLVGSAYSAAPMQMDYAVIKNEQGKRILLMAGGIGPNEHARFQSAVKSAGRIDGFWLSSGGGVVQQAEKIGFEIRNSRLPVAVPSLDRIERAVYPMVRSGAVTESSTLVQYVRKTRLQWKRNVCMSACGMLLSSGLLRFVDEPYSVGLHSSYTPPEILEAQIKKFGATEVTKHVQQTSQLMGIRASRFMQDMGVNMGYAQIAASVPAACMYFLSAPELDALNVVNVQGLKTKGPAGYGRCLCQDPQLQKVCYKKLGMK